tara:strand:+ start:372 stop:866 length:495 start_codon:yes stop_codon:yes gene_type:complete
MKLTKETLKRIIKEELQTTLSEMSPQNTDREKMEELVRIAQELGLSKDQAMQALEQAFERDLEKSQPIEPGFDGTVTDDSPLDTLEEADLGALKKIHQKYRDGQISQQAYEKAKKLFVDKRGGIPSTKDLDLDGFDDPDDKNKEKAVKKLGQVKQKLQKILNQI